MGIRQRVVEREAPLGVLLGSFQGLPGRFAKANPHVYILGKGQEAPCGCEIGSERYRALQKLTCLGIVLPVEAPQVRLSASIVFPCSDVIGLSPPEAHLLAFGEPHLQGRHHFLGNLVLKIENVC